MKKHPPLRIPLTRPQHQTNVINRGKHAEQAALDYLQRHGLKKVAVNFQCRMGEIDIIARDAHTLVFIEVRYRKQRRFGGGAMSITRRKQARIINTAALYLQKRGADCECRFDVIEMSPSEQLTVARQSGQQQYHYNWIKDAFSTQA